jgi:hypothetical protein
MNFKTFAKVAYCCRIPRKIPLQHGSWVICNNSIRCNLASSPAVYARRLPSDTLYLCTTTRPFRVSLLPYVASTSGALHDPLRGRFVILRLLGFGFGCRFVARRFGCHLGGLALCPFFCRCYLSFCRWRVPLRLRLLVAQVQAPCITRRVVRL